MGDQDKEQFGPKDNEKPLILTLPSASNRPSDAWRQAPSEAPQGDAGYK